MKSKVIKNLLIFVGLLVVVIVGYSVFFKKDDAAVGGLASTPVYDTTLGLSGSDVSLGQEFLVTLLNIQNIELDYSIFDSPSFGVLVDFSKPLVQDTNPGRTNPFAPIGVDGTPVSSVAPIATTAPSGITATTAIFSGTITLSGITATRWFEYGTTETMGAKTTTVTQTSSGVFGQNISSLVPNTTYYVRAVAQIGTTSYPGETLIFKTLAQ